MKRWSTTFKFRPALRAPGQLVRAAGLLLAAWVATSAGYAQSSLAMGGGGASEMASSRIPDAPLPVAAAEDGDATGLDMHQQYAKSTASPQRTKHTGYFDTLIDPREIAPRLTVSDKVGMGLKSSVSPFAVIGWVGSATYSEAFNRSPNYGQSGKDYLQRVGAAAARASSQNIFSTSVMASVLHEDPRYFVEGHSHSGFHRAFYALSRVFVTRTDDGASTFNWALISGNAIGAGLTQTYYPAGNRNLRETATTFGTSLGGSGVKFVLEEFFYKEASITQLKRKFEER